MKVVVAAECSAPPEVVFAANMDVPNWPRFIDGINRIDILTSGPIAVGLRVRTTRLIRGQRISSELKLAAMDSPWRIAFTTDDDGRRRVFTSEIVPYGSGSRLTMSCEIIAVTFAARLGSLFSFLTKRRLRQRMQGDIANIAREAERRIRG
jgi:hypothetical protein